MNVNFFSNRFHALRLGLCVLALLSASVVPVSAAPTVAGGGSVAIAENSPPADWAPSYGDPVFSYQADLAFNDGYGPSAFPGFGTGVRCASFRGPWPVGKDGMASVTFPLGDAKYKTFALGQFFVGVTDDDGNPQFSNSVLSSPTLGTCVCMVVTPDPKNPGSYVDLPGAKITFYQCYSDDFPFDGSKWGLTKEVSERTVKGRKVTYAMYGNDPSGLQKTDSGFPSGLARAQYAFKATADGYKALDAADASTVAKPGASWPGQGCIIILQPNAASAPSSVSVQASDPTGGTGSWDGTGTPPTPADTPTTGTGTGTSDGGASDFFGGFWDKLKAFFADMFTLQQADVDELSSIKNKFFTYGPFGLPVSVKREWDNAFLNMRGADGSDPHYWDLPLTLSFGVAGQFGSAYPAGYDPDKAYHPPAAPTVYVSSLFPDHVDLAPFADWVLRARFVGLWGIWGVVALSLIRRFGPTINI